jgi:hypothetical protein
MTSGLILPNLPPDQRGINEVSSEVAQAEARRTSPLGPHAASQRTRRWADGELRKVSWQMMVANTLAQPIIGGTLASIEITHETGEGAA